MILHFYYLTYMHMKTIVKFKALVKTRVRDESGKKIKVEKGRAFKTTEEYAKNYRPYNRLFEELGVETITEPKLDKNKVKNSSAFPTTISDETTNAEIEKILSKMGAKFKKKGKRSDLLASYEARKVEIEEENNQELIAKTTEEFCKMIENRTIDQLQELTEDMDKALEVENIDKEVCEEHIIEILALKIEEAGKKKEGDDEGNSEGSLDGADAGEGANGSDK